MTKYLLSDCTWLVGKGRFVTFKKEYKFHPTRKWRFDYANFEHRIAVEIEGGVWSKGGGRHNRGSGFVGDMEKYNEAGKLGWVVLRYQNEKKELPKILDDVEELLNNRQALTQKI